MIKGIIFDLDGTLLDTLNDIYRASKYILERYGYKVKSKNEIKDMFGGNDTRTFIHLILDYDVDDQYFEEIYLTFIEYYQKNMDDTKPFNGITTLIKYFNSLGIKLAVVSNKPDNQVKTLCKKYFPDIKYVVGCKKNMQSKPSSDMINYILKKMDLKKNEVIYIGDTEIDIETGKHSHIEVVSCDWGYRNQEFLKKNNAKSVISNMQQLLSLIKESHNVK